MEEMNYLRIGEDEFEVADKALREKSKIDATISTMSSNISDAKATLIKKGGVGILQMEFTTNTVVNVGDTVTFTLSGLPTLYHQSKGVGYAGRVFVIVNVTAGGSVSARLLGDSMAANTRMAGIYVPVILN